MLFCLSLSLALALFANARHFTHSHKSQNSIFHIHFFLGGIAHILSRYQTWKGFVFVTVAVVVVDCIQFHVRWPFVVIIWLFSGKWIFPFGSLLLLLLCDKLSHNGGSASDNVDRSSHHRVRPGPSCSYRIHQLTTWSHISSSSKKTNCKTPPTFANNQMWKCSVSQDRTVWAIFMWNE